MKTSLHVLTYNIHKGFTMSNRRFILDKIKKSIETIHADLVFLQEVIGENSNHASKISKWPKASQFEYLADELWPHFAYGKNAIYTQGHHGNAILSKYPITSWENLDISQNRLERRGLLHATIEVPGHSKPLHAICTHLGLFETDRAQQVKQLAARIGAMVSPELPLVVAGDFNDWREQASQVLKKEIGLDECFRKLHGSHARSFPSWLPVLRLDRVYYRGLSPIKAMVLTDKPWSDLSDHAALYSELDYD